MRKDAVGMGLQDSGFFVELFGAGMQGSDDGPLDIRWGNVLEEGVGGLQLILFGMEDFRQVIDNFFGRRSR